MATSSKLLDYLDSFTVKPYFIAGSAQPQPSQPATDRSFVSPSDYSMEFENLRWDEYGNPYVI